MIIPLIFEKEVEEAKKLINEVDGLSPVIQLDIADGKFVDGETLQDISFLNDLYLKSSIELHLMTHQAAEILSQPTKNVTQACVHVELENTFFEAEIEARKHGLQFGAVLNPETPIEAIDLILDKIDYVQFMTIVPGGQGRPLEKNVLEKIKKFKEKYPTMRVQVDGAMNEKTIPLAIEAGADNIGIGSALVKSDDIDGSFKKFTKLI